MSSTTIKEIRLAELLMQEKLERVSPKLEAFRNPSIGGTCPAKIRIKGCRGGRGAGAKSHSLTSLIVQRANYERLRIACFREIYGSLEESVYQLIKEKVEFLRYDGWSFKKDCIISPSGSKFIFRGLKDLRASRNIKGMEGFDIFFIEEAATISIESWNLLLPTLMRNRKSELWFCYNPEEEIDPVAEKIWNRNRDDALCIELMPGKEDNPWWNDGLQKEMEEDFKFDPDEATHIWYGQPRKQGIKCVMSRAKIRAAMSRNIEAVGGLSCGVDVARFGDDKTIMYLRKGIKIIDRKELSKCDTVDVALAVWDFVDRNPTIKIKIDEGYNPGVADVLKSYGAKVICISFGSNSSNLDLYDTVADEMWFTFPIDEADIPDNQKLMQELAGRQYDYDSKNRRKIESKDKFKERYKRSPDDADAILLTFYEGKSIELPGDIKNELAERRRRRAS